MDVAGTVVVVTGGGSGIGREVVLEALRRGARVAAVDLREEALAHTVELAQAGDRLATFAVDIADAAAVAALPGKVEAALGPVDMVMNVAGIIQPFVVLEHLDDAAIRRVIDVNLYGTIHVVKAFLPGLLTRPRAHVVTVSSMGGFLPVPGQAVYGATKAAVKLLTEALYAELLDTRVRVSVVLPGAVGTEIAANSGVGSPVAAATGEDAPSFPMTAADVAARTILDGVAADRLHIHVGRDSRSMGLFVRLAPRRSIHLIQKRMRSLLGG